jgi:hypothetical protein
VLLILVSIFTLILARHRRLMNLLN